jgi:protein-L-isoaspartate(D-aspartate) O-methyltransferase
MVWMDFDRQRTELVGRLKAEGRIASEEVERAMLNVRREDFMWGRYRDDAYSDTPMPIPGGVTVSAPHMHAILLSALGLKPGDSVLEVGFGSGILLAYMREIVGGRGKVIGVEMIPEAYRFGRANLEKAGYRDVKVILGDGSVGNAEDAPFDKIVSGASAPNIPRPWIDQLKPEGIIVTPIGSEYGGQELVYAKKDKAGKVVKKNLGGVVFVKLKGKMGFKD